LGWSSGIPALSWRVYPLIIKQAGVSQSFITMFPIFYATFIDIGEGDITSLIGYVKSFITDLTPLWIPIVAIGMGLVIFGAILSAIRR